MELFSLYFFFYLSYITNAIHIAHPVLLHVSKPFIYFQVQPSNISFLLYYIIGTKPGHNMALNTRKSFHWNIKSLHSSPALPDKRPFLALITFIVIKTQVLVLSKF